MDDSIDPAPAHTVSGYDRQAICSRLKQAILCLCEENYSSKPGLEIDGIICISFINATEQHVVKIHEKLSSENGHLEKHINSPDDDLILIGETSKRSHGFVDEDVISGQYVRPYAIKDNVGCDSRNEDTDLEEHEPLEINVHENGNNLVWESKRPAEKNMSKNVLVRGDNSDDHPSNFNSSVVDPNTQKNVLVKGGNSNAPQYNYVEDCVVKVEPLDNDVIELENSADSDRHELAYEEICPENDINIPKELNLQDGCAEQASSYNLDNTNNDSIEFDERDVDIKVEYGECHSVTQKKNRKHSLEHGCLQPHKKTRQKFTPLRVNDAYAVGSDNDINKADEDVIPLYSLRELPVGLGNSLDSVSYPVKQSSVKNFKSRVPGHRKASGQSASLADLEKTAVDQIHALVAEYDDHGQTHSGHLDPSYGNRQTSREHSRGSQDLFIDEAAGSSQVTLMAIDGESAMFFDRNFVRQKNFFCRRCGAGFTMKSAKSRHENSTCGFACYECSICKKVFNRSDSKVRHMWKMHSVRSPVLPEMDQYATVVIPPDT